MLWYIATRTEDYSFLLSWWKTYEHFCMLTVPVHNHSYTVHKLISLDVRSFMKEKVGRGTSISICRLVMQIAVSVMDRLDEFMFNHVNVRLTFCVPSRQKMEVHNLVLFTFSDKLAKFYQILYLEWICLYRGCFQGLVQKSKIITQHKFPAYLLAWGSTLIYAHEVFAYIY